MLLYAKLCWRLALAYPLIATLLNPAPEIDSLVERLDHSILVRSVDVAGSITLA
jgi:hypothetical protein